MKLGSLLVVVLGFAYGVKADSNATVTLQTPFSDICSELGSTEPTTPYTTIQGVEKCLIRLTAYHGLLVPHERSEYTKRDTLKGKIAAVNKSILQVPNFEPLKKDNYLASTIKSKVATAIRNAGRLKSEISSIKNDVEKRKSQFGQLVQVHTRFKSFAWLTISKKYYHTSFAPGLFRFVQNDKTICFRLRSIDLSEARVIDPNINPRVIPDVIQYLYSWDFTTAQIADFTPPYLRSLTHSMLDRDTCLVSYHGKPDEKRLTKIYDLLSKIAPQFLGHTLLSSSCYVKSSEVYESKKIIESLNASKSVLRKIDSWISDSLKGKTFTFGSDSIESVAMVVENSVLPSAAAKAFLATNPWAVDIIECKIRKAVKVWAQKPIQKREFSTLAIICLGTELGAVALLVLYLIIRPF